MTGLAQAASSGHQEPQALSWPCPDLGPVPYPSPLLAEEAPAAPTWGRVE